MAGYQTPVHLFLHCPLLEQQRELLKAELGHLDLAVMMGSDAAVAMRWAILNFDAPAFAWVREEYMLRRHLRDV
jgi:hypothetical protein